MNNPMKEEVKKGTKFEIYTKSHVTCYKSISFLDKRSELTN